MNNIFEYRKKGEEIIITGLRKGVHDTSIVIPDSIDNMPVTEIADEAFKESSITDIEIGKNIKTIGGKAFSECKELKYVIWNSNSDKISDYCFSNCSALAQFDFSNIKELGLCSFSESGLQKIKLPQSIENVSVGSFAGCEQLKDVVWDCSCDKIPVDCFAECFALTQFDFSRIKDIQGSAFFNSGLNEIYLPQIIENVSDSAFAYCSQLKKVVWNCECNEIPEQCFYDCSALKQFCFSNIKKLRKEAFACSGLTSVSLNKGTEVGKSCFAYCGNLEKVEWLSARSIKGDIFESCKNIKEIFISDNVKNIEVSAFASSPNAEITFV